MSDPKAIADLYNVPEDQRIEILGKAVMEKGRMDFLIDDEEAKIARYLKKLKSKFPEVYEVKRAPATLRGIIVPNTITITLARRQN